MFRRIIFSSLFLLFAIYGYAQPGNAVQYRLEKGKTYKYATEQNMKMSQEMMGRENVTDVFSTSTIIVEPQEIAENGDVTCFASFGAIVVKVHSTMMDTTIATDNFVGKRMKLVVTKYGKTINATPIDSFPQSRMMGAGEATARLKRLFFELPAKGVSVGDTWTRTDADTVEQMGGRILVTSTIEYKATGTENVSGRNCLKVTSTGKYSLEGKGTQMGTEYFVSGQGKTEGAFFFAPEEGLMIAAESTNDQESTIAVTGQQNMTIPQTQNIKSKVTLVQ